MEEAGAEWRGQGGSATLVDSEFCPWGVRPIQTLGSCCLLEAKVNGFSPPEILVWGVCRDSSSLERPQKFLVGLTTHCFQRICGEAASEDFGLSVK